MCASVDVSLLKSENEIQRMHIGLTFAEMVNHLPYVRDLSVFAITKTETRGSAWGHFKPPTGSGSRAGPKKGQAMDRGSYTQQVQIEVFEKTIWKKKFVSVKYV